MFDAIQTLFNSYYEASKTNPFLTTLMLPIIGGLMYFLKGVPGQIWNAIVRNTTVTMRLNNAGWDGNNDAYNAFDRWFMNSGWQKFSRSFFMFRQYKEDLFKDESYKPYRLGIGKGTHIFFYRGRLFWFTKGNLESSGSERQKEEIVVKTLGVNQSCFAHLVDLFNERKTVEDVITIHQYSSSNKGWEEICTMPRRDIAKFCMNEKQKQDILSKLTRFMERREWYYSKGLTYKTSFMFYGPPGTGKTTLSKLLASHFKRDLYILDLSDLTNNSLADALAKIKPGSFLLMEDIDQAGGAVRSRDKKNDKASKVPDILPLSFLTMSGLLNAFDGVVSLDNLIVLMTTNKPEDIDSAVRRKSRIDYEYLIDYLGKDEVLAYMNQMYGVSDLNFVQMMAIKAARGTLGVHPDHLRIAGCEMENIFKEYPEDPQAFLDEVFVRHAGLKLAA